jgi:hypothetical protein
MAKKSGKSKGQKIAGRTAKGGRKTGRKTARKTARAATPRGKAARKRAGTPARPGKRKQPARAGAAKRTKAPAGRTRAKGTGAGRAKGAAPKRRAGGTGREGQLDQTPETGRSVKGRTNPFPTKRSTGTASGAGTIRQAPDLERARRRLREVDETVPSPPSSLTLDRSASAARTGREEMRQARREHTEVSPEITAGDVDADWAGAYDSGDEAPGGDNMTPDQDRVDDIGKALGVEYEDNEELKASDKIAARDKKRWELDPASSDDYKDRD